MSRTEVAVAILTALAVLVLAGFLLGIGLELARLAVRGREETK